MVVNFAVLVRDDDDDDHQKMMMMEEDEEDMEREKGNAENESAGTSRN